MSEVYVAHESSNAPIEISNAEIQLVQNESRKRLREEENPYDFEAWDKSFESLLKYGRANGHCNVKSNEQLYEWWFAQIQEHKREALHPYKLAKLQLLVDTGMLTWNTEAVNTVQSLHQPNVTSTPFLKIKQNNPICTTTIFEDCFLTLAAFGEAHGHCNVRAGTRISTIKRGIEVDLGSWLATRRRERSVHTMSNNCMAYLDILVREGLFTWDSIAASTDLVPNIIDFLWTRRFIAVREYIRRVNVNVTNIPISALFLTVTASGDEELEKKCAKMREFDVGLWLTIQRYQYLNGTIRNDHWLKLQELIVYKSFHWFNEYTFIENRESIRERFESKMKEEESLWVAWYNVLIWYGKRNGHCNLDTLATVSLPDGSEAELGKWVYQQRSSIKHCRLTAQHIQDFQLLIDKGLLNDTWKPIMELYYHNISVIVENSGYNGLLEQLSRMKHLKESGSRSSGNSGNSAVVHVSENNHEVGIHHHLSSNNNQLSLNMDHTTNTTSNTINTNTTNGVEADLVYFANSNLISKNTNTNTNSMVMNDPHNLVIPENPNNNNIHATAVMDSNNNNNNTDQHSHHDSVL